MLSSEADFTVQGTDVYVQGQGAQTLVFIHGWPDTHHLWGSAVRALEGEARRWVMLDQASAFEGRIYGVCYYKCS